VTHTVIRGIARQRADAACSIRWIEMARPVYAFGIASAKNHRTSDAGNAPDAVVALLSDGVAVVSLKGVTLCGPLHCRCDLAEIVFELCLWTCVQSSARITGYRFEREYR